MNSKQLNFFILPEEWDAIELFLQRINVKFIKNPIHFDNENDILERNVRLINGKLPGKLYLTSEEFKPNVALRYNKTDNNYYPDSAKSYLVEFSRGGFSPNDYKILYSARLYYITSYYVSNGEMVRKEARFIKWADDLRKMFKKEFLKKNNTETTMLFSNSAISWMQANHGHLDKGETQVTCQ